jgi:hypothetical protein
MTVTANDVQHWNYGPKDICWASPVQLLVLLTVKYRLIISCCLPAVRSISGGFFDGNGLNEVPCNEQKVIGKLSITANVGLVTLTP